MKILLTRLLLRHPVKSVFVSLLVVVAFLTGVQFIEMATGNDTLVEPETKVYQDNEMLGQEFGGESIIVLFEADDKESLLSVDTFEVMEVLTEYAREHKDVIHSVVSPYTFLEQMLERQGEMTNSGISEVSSRFTELVEGIELPSEQKQSLNELGGQLDQLSDGRDVFHEGLPKTQASLDRLLYEDGGNGDLRGEFAEMVTNDRYTTMMITFRGGVSDTDKKDVVEGVRNAFDERKYPKLGVVISGKPVLDNDIQESMQESIQQMLALSAGFMVVILFVVFQVSWRLLPLAIIFVALLGTVGLMGWIGIPITMVSMAVFPILIGLGIDYAIQFQSRYSEEMRKGVSVDE